VGGVEVLLRDERQNVRAFPPPTAASPEFADVRLPPSFRDNVEFRVKDLATGSGPPVKVEIEVVKVRAGWERTWSSKNERATVELWFRVFGRDGRLLIESGESGSREFRSTDPSDQELRAVLLAACGDAVDAFLTSTQASRAVNASR